MAEYQSPVVMERVLKHIDGDPDPDSKYDMVEVRLASDDSVLATCMMGDDLGLERIADLLAAKRLWREANRFRQMVSDSKKPVRK